MRRSLKSTASRVWKGFHFRLESPSVNWVKHVGGSKLGASMGVICRNLLDIQLSESCLNSYAKMAFILLKRIRGNNGKYDLIRTLSVMSFGVVFD